MSCHVRFISLAYPCSTRLYERVGASGIKIGVTMNVLRNFEVDGQNSHFTILDIRVRYCYYFNNFCHMGPTNCSPNLLDLSPSPLSPVTSLFSLNSHPFSLSYLSFPFFVNRHTITTARHSLWRAPQTNHHPLNLLITIVGPGMTEKPL